VFVIDWTAIGRPPPIVTEPIETGVERRARAGAGSEEGCGEFVIARW